MASLISYTCTSVVTILLIICIQSEAQLSSTFYDSTCPNALTTIRTAIRTAISRERRMAASLIRLHFHDCFVQGCDASILLNYSSTITSEKNALPNLNSARGYEVIDNAKSQVEKICPGVVSCADILTVAARDASFAVGGPSWIVKLGRRDSTTASLSSANTELPGFGDSLDRLVSMFGAKGLSARDMVALSVLEDVNVQLLVGMQILHRLNWSHPILSIITTSRILFRRRVFLHQIKYSLVEDLLIALLMNIVRTQQNSNLILQLP
ncbi:lignin-forming anionic peroxidase-like isoform X2 [Pistacia vera]|uniref:lignin-forming anionic peroxidase-like isoform X2 n=1 Tax=Pistacia vera TaxID=55513 RepID=UPI001263C798|nr:lignin-forming anionic peroxidase-like isoform X2 [Pistacia vera]